MLTLHDAGFVSPPHLAPFSDGLRPGEMVAVVGPNGAGKSTLIALLSGYRRPETGGICLDGLALERWPPEALARRRALVAQRVVLGFDWPVAELVALGSEAGPDEIETALRALDLLPFAERGALSLSGGELQRVMIARALCQLGSPPCGAPDGGLLLLDEPTSALDIGQQQRLMRLLARLAERRDMAICCVLHDLNLAARYAHRVWLMEGGRRIATGTPHEVLTAPRLARVFAAELDTITPRPGTPPWIVLAP